MGKKRTSITSNFMLQKTFLIFYFILARIRRFKMSDDERDIDVESEDEYSNTGENPGAIDKRAHHNASERKRRDHIKDSFTGKDICTILYWPRVFQPFVILPVRRAVIHFQPNFNNLVYTED